MDHDGTVGAKNGESGLKVSHGTFEGVVGVEEDEVVGQGGIEQVVDLIICTAECDFGAVFEGRRTAVDQAVATAQPRVVDAGKAKGRS
jgi:hypothetical protein